MIAGSVHGCVRAVARRPGGAGVHDLPRAPPKRWWRRSSRRSGLRAGADFLLAFSPERIDPGNPTLRVPEHPQGRRRSRRGEHEGRLERSTPSSATRWSRRPGTREAEMAKLLENTYRHVNIALVNEMVQFCHELDIDLWDAIRCAATKPFGFQAFYPGPGVGGHCIPIDPNYLSHRVRTQLGHAFRFVELAQEINAGMPAYVARRVQDLLNDEGKAVKGSRILLLGVTYKANIADQRESPAKPVAEALLSMGADLAYWDPACGRVVRPAAGDTRRRNSPTAKATSTAWSCCSTTRNWTSTRSPDGACPSSTPAAPSRARLGCEPAPHRGPDDLPQPSRKDARLPPRASSSSVVGTGIWTSSSRMTDAPTVRPMPYANCGQRPRSSPATGTSTGPPAWRSRNAQPMVTRPDYLLWLNDDTYADPTALADMLRVARTNPDSIVVAATRDPETGDPTYGASRRTSSLAPPTNTSAYQSAMKSNWQTPSTGTWSSCRLPRENELARSTGCFPMHMPTTTSDSARTRVGVGILQAPGTLATCRRDRAHPTRIRRGCARGVRLNPHRAFP